MAQLKVTEVYIGDLPVTVDEEFIRSNLISNDYEIKEIILKQKKNLEKKFAFVKFEKHEDAKRFMEEMNYTKLDGFPIRISYSDPETRRIRSSRKGNLYIKGLDENIEVSQLHEAFSNFGEIISCKIPMSKNKEGTICHHGYGFIQFRNAEDAEKAKTDLQDASINDKKITIENYEKKAKLNPEDTFTNLYIKDFNPEIIKTEDDLKLLFSQFGRVQSVRLSSSEFKGFLKPFGFCNMENHEDAKSARAQINGTKQGDFTVICNRLQNKSERKKEFERLAREHKIKILNETKGRNLYIKNFSSTSTVEELRQYFENITNNQGKVQNLYIKKDPSGNSLGFGFVCFETKEDAEMAIRQTIFDWHENKLIYCGLSQTKDAREKFIQSIIENPISHVYIPPPPPVDISINHDPIGLPYFKPSQFPSPSIKGRLRSYLLENDIQEKDIEKCLKVYSENQIEYILSSEDLKIKLLTIIPNLPQK